MLATAEVRKCEVSLQGLGFGQLNSCGENKHTLKWDVPNKHTPKWDVPNKHTLKWDVPNQAYIKMGCPKHT